MGYSLLAIDGSRLLMLEMGVLKLSARKDPYERLGLIHKKVQELIVHYRPHDFAIEAPFFGKNVQSMLKLGRAQGVAIAVAMHAGIPVTEYSPKKVKQSVTGNGNADKQQVWKMLQQILQIQTLSQYPQYDASDALAVAVCHHFQERSLSGTTGNSLGKTGSSPGKSTGKKKGWEDIIRNNPGKIRV
jgi:crossover junction endodeoxyribonuclease RuvC